MKAIEAMIPWTEANPAHPLPLSCAGGERQRHRPADERDELAPSHVGHGASPRRCASAAHQRPLLVARRRAGGWFARESALTTLITQDRPRTAAPQRL